MTKFSLTSVSSKILLSLSIIFTASLTIIASSLQAQVNVTGSWTGSSLAGENSYPNAFSMVQSGNKIFGSGVANGESGVITGTISGTSISYHSDYPTLNYSSDATGTTDGKTMSGTFIDSQGTTGTFTAENSTPVLVPKFEIASPPVVQVIKKSVKLNLQRFSKAEAQSMTRALRAKALAKTTIQYDISLKRGSTRQKLTSKKNTITVNNLAPGNYAVSYTASAIKNNKPVFSSKKSPSAVFTIRP